MGDGEILEQGNHDELIRAGGKYANLWSKQFFVKPRDKKNDEAEENLGKAGIIDDLTPEQVSTERSKVTVQSNKDDARDDCGQKSSSQKVVSCETLEHQNVELTYPNSRPT